MLSTMMDVPLSLATLLRHGAHVYGDSEVVTWQGADARRLSFAELSSRAERLAAALRRLGVTPGDRVASFAWNNAEHVEVYLAVPAMGAVLHTLNIRLFPEQVIYIANHAEDRVLVVDASLVATLAPMLAEMKTLEHVLVVGGGPDELEALRGHGPAVSGYEEALAAEQGGDHWVEVGERSAAAMCYTSGTTGNPKGVVYSHRSTVLHSYAVMMGNVAALSETDRVLPVVPMFHANAWGLVQAAWFAGADLVLPDRYLQPAPLAACISAERPTVAGAVPTVWNDLLHHARAAAPGGTPAPDLSSLRLVLCGGSAVPAALIEAFGQDYGVPIQQAWGMTETSPVATAARRPKAEPASDDLIWRAKAGRVLAGVEMRVTGADGTALPWDGTSVGEVEVRGPWVTGSYYLDDDPDKFHDGWLRTGDVGHLDRYGVVTLTDRAKDVIKSGGEWISSVELENAIMAHPGVLEAAVVGIPDERWQERPMACVVTAPGAQLDAEALRAHLAPLVARWWIPEHWVFTEAVPRTSVGKFDKKVIRARHAEGAYTVHGTASPGGAP